MALYVKLNLIQTSLKAPKNLFNKFGGFKYRNCEGILEAVKPYLKEHGCSLLLDDEIVVYNERYYVKANATLIDNETGESIKVSALARESETKKGMDDSQITGATSSYARKYALNGLFLLDDTKDADDPNSEMNNVDGVDKGEDYRLKLVSFIKENNLDKVDICTKYGLNKSSSQKDYARAYLEEKAKIEGKNNV